MACSYNVDDKISGFVAVAYGMLLALVLKRVAIRVEVMGVMTLQRNTWNRNEKTKSQVEHSIFTVKDCILLIYKNKVI